MSHVALYLNQYLKKALYEYFAGANLRAIIKWSVVQIEMVHPPTHTHRHTTHIQIYS